MKGETLMSTRDLAMTMALFSLVIIALVVFGFFAFKMWAKRERLRRGSQIAMAHLDPDCAEVPKKEN